MDKIVDKAIEVLLALGAEIDAKDKVLLKFLAEKAASSVLNSLNLDELPENLFPAVVCLALGEYLKAAKGLGRLDIENLDVPAAGFFPSPFPRLSAQ